MDPDFSFRPERAYLEMARCFHSGLAVDNDGVEVSRRTFKLLPSDVTFALVANSYIMSYTAVIAFVNGQLTRFWDNGALKEKFPDAETFDQLTTKNQWLGDIKTSVKELCLQVGKEPLPQAQNELWNDFKSVVHRARNYYSHPKPCMLEPIIESSFSKEWDFAPRTAAKIIGYFYDDPDSTRNEWLWKNQQFNVLKFRVAKPTQIPIDSPNHSL